MLTHENVRVYFRSYFSFLSMIYLVLLITYPMLLPSQPYICFAEAKLLWKNKHDIWLCCLTAVCYILCYHIKICLVSPILHAAVDNIYCRTCNISVVKCCNKRWDTLIEQSDVFQSSSQKYIHINIKRLPFNWIILSLAIECSYLDHDHYLISHLSTEKGLC